MYGAPGPSMTHDAARVHQSPHDTSGWYHIPIATNSKSGARFYTYGCEIWIWEALHLKVLPKVDPNCLWA